MTLPNFLAALSASPPDDPRPRPLRLVGRTESSVSSGRSAEQDTLRALTADDVEGAGAALEAVFREWYSPLVSFGAVFLADRSAAQDVVQDVFIDAWRRRTTLSLTTSIAAYLHGAVRHRALTHRRDEANRDRLLGTIAAAEGIAPSDMSSDVEADDERRFRAIIQAADALPARAREVFYLRWRQGLSYKEVAAIMEISPKTVEAQMTIALRRIREAVSV